MSEHPNDPLAEGDWDELKVFISRIPAHFDESSIRRLLEEHLGCEGAVVDVSLASKSSSIEENDPKDMDSKKDKTQLEHRGFAFVTLADSSLRQKALDLGTLRGGAKATSTKKFTIYLRPVEREEKAPICFLWTNFRCPYGDACKFQHDGDGGCLEKKDGMTKKKKKCFAYKKGKCKLGDKCPHSHDFEVPGSSRNGTSSTKEKSNETTTTTTTTSTTSRSDSEKDCINWKTKGKCRKGEKCPYRHDEDVRQAFLEKKKRKNADRTQVEGDQTSTQKRDKNRQPISVRVFGLNYETTEKDVKEFFKDCGPIVEVTFPKFDDSGRSKGYCGVLFQSPKAVAKAIAMDGKELHGRWLRVQAGKMYLKQWEEHHSARKENEEQTQEPESVDPVMGEFGQKVKRRKKHGHKE